MLGALIALTKPRIIEFLLVTTVPTMLLAARLAPVSLLSGSCRLFPRRFRTAC
jgi:heme O synthase-like polyprenyltransferase